MLDIVLKRGYADGGQLSRLSWRVTSPYADIRRRRGFFFADLEVMFVEGVNNSDGRNGKVEVSDKGAA